MTRFSPLIQKRPPFRSNLVGRMKLKIERTSTSTETSTKRNAYLKKLHNLVGTRVLH
jgi:hypothetical protein